MKATVLLLVFFATTYSMAQLTMVPNYSSYIAVSASDANSAVVTVSISGTTTGTCSYPVPCSNGRHTPNVMFSYNGTPTYSSGTSMYMFDYLSFATSFTATAPFDSNSSVSWSVLCGFGGAVGGGYFSLNLGIGISHVVFAFVNQTPNPNPTGSKYICNYIPVAGCATKCMPTTAHTFTMTSCTNYAYSEILWIRWGTSPVHYICIPPLDPVIAGTPPDGDLSCHDAPPQ